MTGVLIPESGIIINRSKKTGYVGPSPLIIDGSLRENLLFGSNKNLDDNELIDLINEFSLLKIKQT